MWLPKVPIRQQIICYFYFSRGLSVEETAVCTELNIDTIRPLHRIWVDVISEEMELENENFVFGGDMIECEADEIALRCIAGHRGQEQGVWWLRLIGFVERGDCGKVFLAWLPERCVPNHGKGGGGALAIEELREVLRLKSGNPRLLPLSILHTDSAKAYRHVGPLRWPKYVLGGIMEADEFLQHRWTTTKVVHKRKVGQPTRYVEYFRVRCAYNKPKDVLGGAQKIDGFWAFLRKHIGRLTVPTGTPLSAARSWFQKRVRVAQWMWVHCDENRFELFCRAVARRRAGQSTV